MVTIETIATVTEDGTITARAPGLLTRGRHRVVLVLDEVSVDDESTPACHGFPDMTAFRESLGVSPSQGNTILEMRGEERTISIEQKGLLRIAMAVEEGPPLEEATVDAVLQELREHGG